MVRQVTEERGPCWSDPAPHPACLPLASGQDPSPVSHAAEPADYNGLFPTYFSPQRVYETKGEKLKHEQLKRCTKNAEIISYVNSLIKTTHIGARSPPGQSGRKTRNAETQGAWRTQ